MTALRLLLLSLAVPVPAAAEDDWISPVRLDTSDVIPYRALQRGDFQGEHPPKVFLGRVDLPRPVAVSCAYVAADPRARVFAEPVGYQRRRYRPRVEDLTFRAMFSRSCSWWNRDHGLSPTYVLQHEQIHFALFEAAARRLNRDVPRMLASAALEADLARLGGRRRPAAHPGGPAADPQRDAAVEPGVRPGHLLRLLSRPPGGLAAPGGGRAGGAGEVRRGPAAGAEGRRQGGAEGEADLPRGRCTRLPKRLPCGFASALGPHSCTLDEEAIPTSRSEVLVFQVTNTDQARKVSPVRTKCNESPQGRFSSFFSHTHAPRPRRIMKWMRLCFLVMHPP